MLIKARQENSNLTDGTYAGLVLILGVLVLGVVVFEDFESLGPRLLVELVLAVVLVVYKAAQLGLERAIFLGCTPLTFKRAMNLLRDCHFC